MPLFREVGLLPATFLVIGNMIGIGIFTTSGLIAAQLGGSVWLIGVWIVAGALAMMGAFCYSRLGVRFPRAGGEYAFLYSAYGPLAAFLSGWASLIIGFSAPIAAAALGFSHYLQPYHSENAFQNPLARKAAAILLLLAVSILISLGLKAGVYVHSLVTLANCFLILVFALLVLGRVTPETHLMPVLTGGWGVTSIPSLGSALILTLFSYSGWNAAAYIAEEIKSPNRNIPGALLLGTGSVILFYVLINLAYFSAAPLSLLQGEVAVAEVVAQQVFAPFGQHLVTLLILVSILSSLTAMSIAGPRVYFAMARDRLFPSWLSEVHAGKKLPLKAIWFQTLIAVVMIAVGDLYQILLYAGFVLVLFSTLTVSVLLKRSSRWLLPGLFVAVNTLILINSAIFSPRETLAGCVTVALGIPVYFFYQRRNQRPSRDS